MENQPEINPYKFNSNLSISSETENVVKKEEKDLFANDFPTWSSRSKCLQAYACLIIKFTTVLRVCYSLGVYGTTILVPYSLFRIFFGVPLVLAEIMLARYVMGNIVKTSEMCPFSKGTFTCFLLITFAENARGFSQLVYLFKYMISSAHEPLPWKYCNEKWAKDNCYTLEGKSVAFHKCLLVNPRKYCENLTWQTSGEKFWHAVAGNTQGTVTVAFSFLYLFLGIFTVVIINYKGIKSLEKFFYLFLHTPLILASFTTFVSFLVPGAARGFRNLWFIDLSLLVKPKLWEVGFLDSLLSLSFGVLSLPLVSSHGKFFDDILIDVLMVVFSEILCNVFIAVPILSIIATIKFDRPLFKDHLDTFIWISEALLVYPFPNELWAFIFYLEMVLLDMGTSAILFLALSEAFVGIFHERINFFYISFIIGLSLIVICVPILFVPWKFNNPGGVVYTATIFLQMITLQIFYGIKKFIEDFHFMMGYQTPIFFAYTWLAASFIACTYIFFEILSATLERPFNYAVCILTSIPFLIYFVVALAEVYKAYKEGKIVEVFSSNPEWGPGNSLLKKSRIVFNSKAVTKEFMYRQELYKKPFIKPNDFSDQNIVHLI